MAGMQYSDLDEQHTQGQTHTASVTHSCAAANGATDQAQLWIHLSATEDSESKASKAVTNLAEAEGRKLADYSGCLEDEDGIQGLQQLGGSRHGPACSDSDVKHDEGVQCSRALAGNLKVHTSGCRRHALPCVNVGFI